MILYEMSKRKNNMICFDLALEIHFDDDHIEDEIHFDDEPEQDDFHDLKIFFEVCDDQVDLLTIDLNSILKTYFEVCDEPINDELEHILKKHKKKKA